MNDKVSMPDNWDDHDGWETYFSLLPSSKFWFNIATTHPGSFSFNHLGSLMDEMYKRKWKTIWFPGCGFSPLPRAFTSFGFTVYATDIAPTAIQYQNNNQSIVKPLLTDIIVENIPQTQGCLKTQIHDFRTSFKECSVDVIFNIKSIQGLSQPSLISTIQSHFSALRFGGTAFFDTLNVQGKRRDLIEDTLVDAGFYIPLYQLNKWYRKALTDTGIPYVFVLGKPIIPQNKIYPYKYDSPEYNRDKNILRNITADYLSKVDIEYKKEEKYLKEERKKAQTIYSTG